MVEGEARHCDIETRGFLQIFDPTAAEDPTIRGPRIDCHDVIAGALQRSRKPGTCLNQRSSAGSEPRIRATSFQVMVG